MKKSELISKLVKIPNINKQEFNSCNGWGFGGGIGTSYSFDNKEIRIFTAHYRHANSESVITVSIDNKRVLDQLINAKSIQKANDLIFG